MDRDYYDDFHIVRIIVWEMSLKIYKKCENPAYFISSVFPACYTVST